ncbi:MAG: hypothetical protein K5679_00240 [Lachnospiraceae bacterium]|nr:hypothetical protein [Lachnospiraceae bacterium]
MFYVVKPSGVVSAPTLRLLNKKMNAHFDEDEFKVVGKDFMVICKVEDLDFVQDKAKMENLCFAGFFRKDNAAKMFALINLILTFICMIMIGKLG